MKKSLLIEVLKEKVRYLIYEAENLLEPDGTPKELPKLSSSQAESMIRGSNGKIFTISFYKRSTGELRVMNARLGVKAYLKGGSLPYVAKEHNLLTVFDLQKKAYRQVNLDALETLKINGITYQIVGDAEALDSQRAKPEIKPTSPPIEPTIKPDPTLPKVEPAKDTPPVTGDEKIDLGDEDEEDDIIPLG